MTTSAREQSSRLADLLRREHSAMADFVVALSKFDRERGWEQLGYPSLFSFLRRELRLSAGAAQYRKTAAELVQRYPEVEAALRAGDLCLSSVIELGKVVTPENVADLLPRFFGLSSRDAAAVAVSVRPVQDPPLRESVTRISLPAPAVVFAPAAPASSDGLTLESVRAPEMKVPNASAPAPIAPPPTKVTPLDADLRRLNVTVSRRLLEKLEAARSALSHSHPGAATDQILEVGLDLILQRFAKRRGIGAKPRAAKQPPEQATSPSTPRSRHVPAHVWRGVWERDRGCCAWPLANGGVCGSTDQLELDHVKGFALGAGTTVAECRILCRHHQDVSARQIYGDGLMNSYTKPKGPGCSEPVEEYARRSSTHASSRCGRRCAEPSRPCSSRRNSLGTAPRMPIAVRSRSQTGTRKRPLASGARGLLLQ